MLVLQEVRGTTPRGRQWITQISYDTNDVKLGEIHNTQFSDKVRTI